MKGEVRALKVRNRSVTVLVGRLQETIDNCLADESLVFTHAEVMGALESLKLAYFFDEMVAYGDE